MELVKPETPVEFVWKDVTFYIRPTATAGDKFSLTNGAPMTKDGKQTFVMSDFWKKIIEIFVVKWSGVTKDGQDVPFSMDALAQLPVDNNDDVFVRLGAFIVDTTKIVDRGEERKNESGQP